MQSQNMQGMSMLSGSELPYNGDYWVNLPNTEKLNCYDYAFGNADPTQKEYSQPIERTSDTHIYTCDSVEQGMMAQNPDSRVVEFEESCNNGERKIALFIDDVHPSDYHWYRQDADGYWSHKPGYQHPRRHDAQGKLIAAPHKSDRQFEHFNYTNQCNYYCIPSNSNFAK